MSVEKALSDYKRDYHRFGGSFEEYLKARRHVRLLAAAGVLGSAFLAALWIALAPPL